MKKYIKLDKVKDFLFDHGEKVALGSCLCIALVLGSLGLLRTASAGREEKSGLTWTELFGKEHDRIRGGIDKRGADAPAKTLLESLIADFYDWFEADLKYAQGQYNQISEDKNVDKRDSPQMFALRSGKNTVHLEYWKGLVVHFEHGLAQVDGRNVTAVKGLELPGLARPPLPGMGNAPPVRLAKPARMVVGTLIFPMKQQVAEFARALRMKNQAELLTGKNKDDLPKPLGFNLVRYEVVDGQPVGKGEDLVQYDGKKNEVTMSRAVRTFLRDAMCDEKFAEALEPHIWTGLVMPTPQIAHGHFARFDLDGIYVDWAKLHQPNKVGAVPVKKKAGVLFPAKDKKAPMKENLPDNVLPDGKPVDVPEKQLKLANPGLAARLFDTKFNVFHPLGDIAPAPGKAAIGPPIRFISAWEVKSLQPMDEEKPPVEVKPGDPPAVPEGPVWDRDAIVRFIDPEVEPGRTYEYTIQLIFANPNYKKGALVALEKNTLDFAFSAGALTKTPSITIPHEYALYAVDQQLLDDWLSPPAKPVVFDPKVYKDSTTFQIHQWIKKRDDFAGNEYLIGDWAIAERQLVRKGEFIGAGAEVKVPVWRKLKDAFEVPLAIEKKDGKKGAIVGWTHGMKIDLTPPADGDNAKAAATPPVLVDFYGGKKFKGQGVEEETAVDALIMRADGVLEVLNSRIHSEDRDRQKRREQARSRVEELIGPQ